MKKLIMVLAVVSVVCHAQVLFADALRYNAIVLFTDDISARELPAYGSSVWAPPVSQGSNTSDLKYRAKTPVLDRLAQEGAFVSTAWANAICSPSRATLMTGRYAHLHKWWHNNDIGDYINDAGERRDWPLYRSSPYMIGHVAQNAGYTTAWVGKTQMNKDECDISEFGFDAVLTSPGGDIGLDYDDFALSDFIHFNPAMRSRWYADTSKKMPFISADTGKALGAVWSHASFFWQPFMAMWNVPGENGEMHWWPQSAKEKDSFGLQTYGPDVEMDFSLRCIEQSLQENKPFFIYHTPHLGHMAFDYLGQRTDDEKHMLYPGTPMICWNGEKYIWTKPRISGDSGNYDMHGTVTDTGIHHHINYLDYQVWQYRTKLRELGIEDQTLFIFAADNGTASYGKMHVERQRGLHVPFYIYFPGMVKTGRQDILVDVTDILPTIADVVGFEFPEGYELNGRSLLPYFLGESETHREWIYSFLFEKQLIRGHYVLRDGNGDWWDVSEDPADLDSYPKITDWEKLSLAHRRERDQLLDVLPCFNKHASEHDAPGVR